MAKSKPQNNAFTRLCYCSIVDSSAAMASVSFSSGALFNLPKGLQLDIIITANRFLA